MPLFSSVSYSPRAELEMPVLASSSFKVSLSLFLSLLIFPAVLYAISIYFPPLMMTKDSIASLALFINDPFP